MNKLIDKLFEKDIAVKIISVLTAILIWFLVLDQDNPFTERTISVPLTSNVDVLESKNLQIVGAGLPESVDIKIKGRKQRLDSVTPNDFKASVDLSDVAGSGDQSIKIEPPEYTGSKDIIISGINPTALKLRLEKIIGKQYPVNVEFSGKLPDGLEVVNLKVDPGNVLIQEREGILAKVNKVVTLVNLQDLSVTKELVIRASVYDTSGKPMSQFEGKFPTIVSYDLAKKLPVSTSVTGTPKDGYYFKEIVLDMPDVSVTGTKELLDTLTRINADAINIDGKSENFSTDLSLVMPKGAALLDTETPVTASIMIQPLLTKTVSIPTSMISIYDSDTSGAWEYRLPVNSFSIKVAGRPELIQSLMLSSIQCSISVKDLGEGDYPAPVTVSLPYGISLKENVVIDVKIVANTPQEPTPTPTPTPTITPGQSGE